MSSHSERERVVDSARDLSTPPFYPGFPEGFQYHIKGCPLFDPDREQFALADKESVRRQHERELVVMETICSILLDAACYHGGLDVSSNNLEDVSMEDIIWVQDLLHGVMSMGYLLYPEDRMFCPVPEENDYDSQIPSAFNTALESPELEQLEENILYILATDKSILQLFEFIYSAEVSNVRNVSSLHGPDTFRRSQSLLLSTFDKMIERWFLLNILLYAESQITNLDIFCCGHTNITEDSNGHDLVVGVVYRGEGILFTIDLVNNSIGKSKSKCETLPDSPGLQTISADPLSNGHLRFCFPVGCFAHKCGDDFYADPPYNSRDHRVITARRLVGPLFEFAGLIRLEKFDLQEKKRVLKEIPQIYNIIPPDEPVIFILEELLKYAINRDQNAVQY